MKTEFSSSKIKYEYSCSLLLAHDLIGGKWKQRILWHIIHGHNRYSLLRKGIPEITPNVLASQLHELEDAELIIKEVIKEVIKEDPPKTILYHINDCYKELIPLVESICDFSKKYADLHQITISGEEQRN